MTSPKISSPIDNHDKRQEPGRDEELRKAVAQEKLSRIAAASIYYCELDVSQESYENKNTREVEVGGMEAGHHLGRHRIHDIAHQRDAARDGDGLVDEGEVVSDGVLPGRFTCLVHPQYIVASLGKGQKQSQEVGHQYEPVAHCYARGKSTHKDAQHESEGYHTYIDNGITLESGAIRQVE